MKLSKYALGLVLIFSFGSVWAAEATIPPVPSDEIKNNAEQLDTAPDIADSTETEEELETDEVEISPARVIPTEQISQDIGVSFPIDI